MKKISLLLVTLLITSIFSGCIGQERPVEDNNTSTPSYNSTQSGHPSLLSMLFWSSFWHKHMTPNIRAAKSYIDPDPATKKDASNPYKTVDAKDPTDTTEKTDRNSLIPDTGSKPKPKVKTTTPRIRRGGRR